MTGTGLAYAAPSCLPAHSQASRIAAPKFKLLDLFSGIGGFSLGLERSGGFETVAFCEIDPFCRKVLAKHWPKVPCYDDIRSLTADRLAADGLAVDAICGGFPCQDISNAGKRAGMDGERSGLWSQYARLIGELRPRYVIVENVAALLGRGLDRVLGDLAALGFDAEWHCIPASAVGAPHRRDRLWVVAFPQDGIRRPVGRGVEDSQGQSRHQAESWTVLKGVRQPVDDGPATGRPDVANANEICSEGLRDIRGQGLEAQLRSWEAGRRSEIDGADWWKFEPAVGRMAHGVSSRMDRLSGLGNAVVPQIPELIGRAIMAAQGQAS